MLYLLTIFTAALLATGQMFWKKAAVTYPTLIADHLSPTSAALRVIFSTKFFIGAFLYVVATLIYLWLFSKYPYYIVQTTLMVTSLVLTAAISVFIFKEELSLINLLGISIILFGVFLVSAK
ncbi:MAG: hypothetical protein WCP14_02390 [bacterium]